MVTGKRAAGESGQVRVFSALGDPTREAIVRLLADGPLPVHRLASRFPVSRPAVSRHLRLLKEAGIVSERRRGRERAYFLRREALAQIGDWVALMESGGEAERPAKAAGVGERPAKAAASGVGAAPAKSRRRRTSPAGREVAPAVERTGPAPAKSDNWKAW